MKEQQKNGEEVRKVPVLLRKIVLLLPFNPRASCARILMKSAKNARIVLDVACGHGGNAIVTKYLYPKSYIIGFDIFRPRILECKSLKVYDDLLIADVRFPPFSEKSVDVTYFTETIEHLEKEDGFIALKNLERISRKAILITTPKEFGIGAIEDVIKERNVFQLHRSKWLPSEFKRRGYLVWGGIRSF
jgi:ubiquinone/menaquinone biosynthesis C-methylase UbiE